MERQFAFTFPAKLKERVIKNKPKDESIAEYIRTAIEQRLKNDKN